MQKDKSVALKFITIFIIGIFLLSACSFSEALSKLQNISVFEKTDKSQVDYSSKDGVLVSSVMEGSPAEAAGIERGDIILEIAGEPVNSLEDIRRLLSKYKAGDQVEVLVLHGEQFKSLQLTFAEEVSLGVFINETWQENSTSDWTPGSLGGFALVVDVINGSPAAQAGLERGDMILALNGKTLSAENGLVDLLAAYEPGDEVTLQVYSSASQENTEIPVVLGENPEDAERAYLGIKYQDFTGMGDMQFQQGMPFSNFPGLDEENLPDEDLPDLQNDLFDEDFNLPESDMVKSLLVKEVVENSPADEAGLQEGDIILELNGQEVSGQENFAAEIRSYSPGDSVTLTVSRDGLDEPFEIKVVLDENPTEEGAGYLGIKVGVFINMDVSMNNGPIFIDFLPFNAQARIGL